MQNYLDKLTQIIAIAIEEDQALHDITSDATLEDSYQVDFAINSRQDITLAGIDAARIVIEQLKNSEKFTNCQINLHNHFRDGDFVPSGQSIISGNANAKLLFAAERIILNTIQHLSGISTNCNNYVNTLNDSNITILDTRKTTIALRELEKYAVSCSDAVNHRNDLADCILIKDNHIASNSSILQTVLNAKLNNKNNLPIIVECDNLEQVQQIVELGVDRIMLDNMTIEQINQAITIINKKAQIEVSGGINIQNIANYRGLDIDFISVGSLTHSSRAVDIGLDIN